MLRNSFLLALLLSATQAVKLMSDPCATTHTLAQIREESINDEAVAEAMTEIVDGEGTMIMIEPAPIACE